jgi:hypothetical protein
MEGYNSPEKGKSFSPPLTTGCPTGRLYYPHKIFSKENPGITEDIIVMVTPLIYL